MNVNEATQAIQRRFPKMKIIGCGEYPKYFVFALVGKNARPMRDGDFLSSGWKVNRITGEITQFHLASERRDDFRNGKEVKLD